MRTFVGIIFMVLYLKTVLAQDQIVHVKFTPTLYGNIVANNKNLELGNDDSIAFSALKLYISNVVLTFKNGEKQALNHYYLLDLLDERKSTIVLSKNINSSISHLSFGLGIDSVTNAAGVQGGSLDPTLGMYWAWQSGYINFKMEGTSSRCLTRNNEFSFHLGGFRAPYLSYNTATIEVENDYTVEVYLELSNFFKTYDLSSNNQVMSPCSQANTG